MSDLLAGVERDADVADAGAAAGRFMVPGMSNAYSSGTTARADSVEMRLRGQRSGAAKATDSVDVGRRPVR
jgi:hypothetical protein